MDAGNDDMHGEELIEMIQITGTSVHDRKINYYQILRNDVRGEIKTRISQRDNFAVQMITALGILGSAVFANKGLDKVLIIAPLISIYYTMQILYSYRLHDILSKYLREQIEPTISLLCETDPEHEWERFYKNNAKPGIRRRFFMWCMWFVCIGSMAFLWIRPASGFVVILIITSILYLIGLVKITLTFKEDL